MKAKRSLGQNFLRDTSVVNRIVGALGPVGDRTIVEIGAGRGALTEKLLEEAGRLIAIEFDRDMIDILTERFGPWEKLTLVNADALDIEYLDFLRKDDIPAKLVANLPYNISTPILQSLAAQRQLFSTMVLMFQKEVVERITATPGGKERGFLSVIVEDAFATEYLFDVPPDAFRPVPRVWSSVVRLTPKASVAGDPVLFRKVVSVSFTQKRKTILNNLKAFLRDPQGMLADAGIDGIRRAETLTLEEWRRLIGIISSSRQPGPHS
jgi:16S rRNA (adenine1518-N6/adenine1519-N6)-dimethyltransferase